MPNQFGFRHRLDEIEIRAGRPSFGDILRSGLVEIMRIGRVAVPGAPDRSDRKNVKPSMRGILTSTITRSNGSDNTFSIASIPLIACSTAKPAFSSADL